MVDIEQYELETFNRINDLNKKIYRVESQMRTLFFGNVEMDSKEILPPVVSTRGYSDYERIEREKKFIKLEIKDIDKKLANMQSFSNIIINGLKGKNLSEEEIEQESERVLKNIELELISNKKSCLERLESIENDPSAYLRFLDFQSSDFSKVESEEIKEKLEELNGVLKGYTEERDSLLKGIRKAEKKEKNPILGLSKKSSKKSIDKK